MNATRPHPNRLKRRALVTAGFLFAVGVCGSAAAGPLTAVQVVGLNDAESASRVASRIRALGSPALVRHASGGGFAVQAGAFSNLTLARRHAARLRAAGLEHVSLQPVTPVADGLGIATKPAVGSAAMDAIGARSEPVPGTALSDAPVPPQAIAPSTPLVLAIGNGGPPPRAARSAPAARSSFSWQATQLHAETMGFTGDDRLARHNQFLHASGGLLWHPSATSELRLTARSDGYWQQGWRDHDEIRLDYDEVYLRRRWSQLRLTAGAQRVAWGRVDEIAPTDRLSVVDLTRMVLDRLPQRRRTVPALRAEWFALPGKLDLVWIPAFRPAELPDDDSAWHPVNRRDGRFLSLPRGALQSALIRAGRFDDDDSGSGGGGLRYSQELSGFDYGLSAQRVRHSTPYYELDERVRAALATGSSVPAAVALAPDTFVGRHPYTWVLGGDAGLVTGRTTWRMEAAWLSTVPVTDATGALDTVDAINTVAGAEFYPGDRDLRINLQVGANVLLGPSSILDRRRRYFTNGTVFYPFGGGRFEFETRYSLGLNVRDVYLNPELRYVYREPHQLYLAIHVFRGADDTLGGFFHDNTGITLGWRSRL